MSTVRQIAILDDSTFVLHSTRRDLEAAGFGALCFDDPASMTEQGLTQAALVLVDVNMREVLGDDVVAFLREQLGVRAPILLFSSVTEEELRERARRAGADGYIVKGTPLIPQILAHLGEGQA